MPFKHLTANGSVDWGQPERAAVGEGNGQPRAGAPTGGQRGEGGVSPPSLGPWGHGDPEPGETGSFWRATR